MTEHRLPNIKAVKFLDEPSGKADKPSTVYVVDGADLDEHYRQSQEAERIGRDYMAYRLEQVKSRIIARYHQKGGIGVTDI